MTKFCSNLTYHLNFAKTNLFQSAIIFFACKHVLLVLYQVWLNMVQTKLAKKIGPYKLMLVEMGQTCENCSWISVT